MKTTAGPLSGRRAQAARNDERILEAARAVFLADPGAPISEVAKQAKVGIGALYRRFASKEEVLRRLSSDGLSRTWLCSWMPYGPRRHNRCPALRPPGRK
jgi:AcrR family transcriptional regulator